MIDFRSDTVTRPTKEMQEAMFAAKIGDDVFGEDPTVNELENLAADRFGHEAALFCPSGTMTNQIAIKVHTVAGDEVICDELSHVYQYEGGGIAFNSSCSVKLLRSERGLLSLSDVVDSVRTDDVHFPKSSLLVLENTCNKGGGAIYAKHALEELSSFARTNALKIHLDGARLFNALVESDYDEKFIGKQFNTISICLSKGLGCPVGSLLIGSHEDIKKARRFRKVFGGGMRQAGYLAAAGVYALNHHVNRLKEDHQKAQELTRTLEELPFIDSLYPVESNIVIANFENESLAQKFIASLASQGIKVISMGKGKVRFVTHLDISFEQLEETQNCLKKIVL